MISSDLRDKAVWEQFYQYKIEKSHLTSHEAEELKAFIDREEFLPVAERMLRGELSIPTKKLIRKQDTDKKRTVYLFPREENYVLKLLTYLLIRKYDDVFSDKLYSFRVHFGVSRAVSMILHMKSLKNKYVYKLDVSNYFNSIPTEKLLQKLRQILLGSDTGVTGGREGINSNIEQEVYRLFESMLTDKRVYINAVNESAFNEATANEDAANKDADNEAAFNEDVFNEDTSNEAASNEDIIDSEVSDNQVIVIESKGAMAGCPTAVFLANLYLSDLDQLFSKPILNPENGETYTYEYARYSDDIILFADSLEARAFGEQLLLRTLLEHGLSVNEKKVNRMDPGEPWDFLGIRYEEGVVDISPVAAEKLKNKIRRRARSIRRWLIRKKATPEQGVRALIRSMNRKFFNAESEHDLTWCRWYFPLITTDRTLHEIDLYLQDWIRYVYTGRHQTRNYRYTYEKMKQNGYISLVNEWYKGS